jgi:hypothetical protein
VVIAVAVTPSPVLFLFFGRQLAEIPMFVTVVFAGPLLVIDDLAAVPDVIIAVVGVIDPIVMLGASRAYSRTRQRGGQET